MLKSKTSEKKRSITERDMTPAERRKVAELRQKIKDRNKRQLQKTGIKTSGEIEVTESRPTSNKMEVR